MCRQKIQFQRLVDNAIQTFKVGETFDYRQVYARLGKSRNLTHMSCINHIHKSIFVEKIGDTVKNGPYSKVNLYRRIEPKHCPKCKGYVRFMDGYGYFCDNCHKKVEI